MSRIDDRTGGRVGYGGAAVPETEEPDVSEQDDQLPDPTPVVPGPIEEEPSTTGVVADDEAAEVDED